MPLGAFKAALMGTAGVSTETVVLLYDTDHSNVSSVAITSGITSTYGEYIFKWYNVNPVDAAALFTCQFNAAGESGFNETITSTAFQTYHAEADNDTSLAVAGTQAQGTANESLSPQMGNAGDEHGCGELHLFNPASTTYVKHFYSTSISTYKGPAYAWQRFGAGYINTTTAIDEISFQMDTGNFDGTIKMWGVK